MLDKAKDQYKTDFTLNMVKESFSTSGTRLSSATGQYLIQKVPIVQWLPRYSPKWILNDFVAGMTIGTMMIPQALSYAKIATIPGVFGLYSSWLPAAIYVFMGTSKDLSTGPTSIMGLLTAEIIAELSTEGFAPQDIAAAVAFMVGIYSTIMGFFKLGFVLDYISVPVLSGFLSAAALTILLGQVGSLVGLNNVPSATAAIIRNVLSRITQWDGITCAIGLGGMALLYTLELLGKKWGKNNFALRFISSSRAVIVLFIFTTISYLVNKDRDHPLWSLSKISADGIIAPKIPAGGLISRVAVKSVAPLAASALEHLAIGRAFGRKNGYTIDTSQELNFLGITNFLNSFFGAMPVGGAMSRTAVNSECGVKSPLSGIFTAGFILLTLYKLSGALFWIPNATLAAIIIMAVIHLIGPASIFYRHWRISFADFTASMLSFWITLFVSTEMGIAVAVIFSIAYTMLRSVFTSAEIWSVQLNSQWQAQTRPTSTPATTFNDLLVPSDALLVRFTDAIFFPNANRVKTGVVENVQVLFEPTRSPAYSIDNGKKPSDSERSWSVVGEKRIQFLRKRDQITPVNAPLNVMVWDFSRVPFMDVTGVYALAELKEEVAKYVGKDVQVRFVGVNEKLRLRFKRASWDLAEDGPDGDDRIGDSKIDVMYPSIESALWNRAEFVGDDNDSLRKV